MCVLRLCAFPLPNQFAASLLFIYILILTDKRGCSLAPISDQWKYLGQ